MDLEQSRQVLIDHSKSKKNGDFPLMVTHSGQLTNPICGDHVELKLHVRGKNILRAGFAAKACAICSASASLLCDELHNVAIADAIQMTQTFESQILAPAGEAWPPSLSAFQCFEHLRVNPSRKTCALLPFVALRSILKKI
jgi:nitrogen fixation protein NifU and related proteins